MKIERVITAEGVYYPDPETQAAALAWFERFEFSLPKLDAYIDDAAPDAQRAPLLDYRRRAIEAHGAGNDDAVLPWLLFFTEVVRSFTYDAVLMPLATVGNSFRSGRKPGTAGPVRLAVRQELQRTPRATAAEVWRALKLKRVKGLAFVESARLGRYIESAGHPDTSYRRFANIVSEERPK